MDQEQDWFETEDLLIYPAHRDWAAEIADFYTRNRAFLAPFEPKRPESFYTVSGQKRELRAEEEDIRVGRGMRLYLAEKQNPEVICGMVGLNNIVWGSVQSCTLGYKIDKDLQGKGYATRGKRGAGCYQLLLDKHSAAKLVEQAENGCLLAFRCAMRSHKGHAVSQCYRRIGDNAEHGR